MKKLIISSTFVFALVLSAIFSGGFVSAQTTTDTTSGEKSTARRCTVAHPRLQERVTRITTLKTKQQTTYTTVSDRVQKIVTSASDNGYDTAALLSANSNLVTKIRTYTEKVEAYNTALKATATAACATTPGDGEYATSLLAARTALIEARTASADVRSTFKNEVVPALKDYAAWLKDKATTKTTEENQ